MTNRVVHFDIYVDDAERAIAFYQKVFGWTIQKVDGMDYWLSDTPNPLEGTSF
jgi:predicted enzyme related to lactoylglutathione lyase